MEVTRAIGSSVILGTFESVNAVEFHDCVNDLLQLEDVQKLDDFSQHMNTSRLQHSINVSYYSYLMCKFLHFDYRSAARAGLLHDLYLYDWRVEQRALYHAGYHPKEALKNARVLVDLNKIEADAIVKHMWPLTPSLPRYKESFIVTLADKYCTGCEVLCQTIGAIRRRLAFF